MSDFCQRLDVFQTAEEVRMLHENAGRFLIDGFGDVDRIDDACRRRNDNEFGAAFRSDSINMLVGDGNVRELNIEELKKYDYPEDPPEDYKFDVGRNSSHPMLKKLDL